MASLHIYLGIYSILLISVAYYFTRRSNDEDFLIGGRNRSSFSILASKFAGAVGISTFITFTGFAYAFGTGIFWLVGGLLIGYLLFALWASPRVKRLSLAGKFYTFGDMSSFITGNITTGKLTNGITVFVDFFGVLLSLVGGAKVIAYFGIMDYENAVIITSFIILCYVLLSGFNAVILTDIIQAFIILFLLGFTVYNILKTDSYTDILDKANYELPAGSLAAFIIYGCLSVFGMADRYQLCYAGKSEKVVKKGMLLSILPILIVAFLLLFIGLKAYSINSHLDAGDAFTFIISKEVSVEILPLFLIMLFAGLMSTADSSIFAISSHLISNTSKINKVKQIRITTILVIIAAASISFLWQDIVNITLVGSGMRIILAIPTIYILLKNKNPYRYIGSAIGGVLGVIIGIVTFGISPKITLTILLGSLLGLIFKKPIISAKII